VAAAGIKRHGRAFKSATEHCKILSMNESLLFAIARISTFAGPRVLTAASGFFFRREDRLFLVTARHVLLDAPSGHHPDRAEVMLHTDPVARHAVVASAFGVRFQGQGYFLTDARMHRGASGAPVVLRDPRGDPDLPWKLLGIHSARLDMRSREEGIDESLGLNCAWYADILRTLTT
jgi:hypothetical protein